MTNPNDSTAPIIQELKTSEYSDLPATLMEVTQIGLTKRECFAAMAMQGILAASTTGASGFYDPNAEIISEVATRHADALIEALNKK